jgi:hypothetical protein
VQKVQLRALIDAIRFPRRLGRTASLQVKSAAVRAVRSLLFEIQRTVQPNSDLAQPQGGVITTRLSHRD